MPRPLLALAALAAVCATGCPPRRYVRDYPRWIADGGRDLRAGCAVADAHLDAGVFNARFDGKARRFALGLDGDRIVVHDGERRRAFEHTPPFAFERSESAGSDSLRAPMPGRIVLVKAAVGDSVEQGQEILVIEAMKMELSLKAPQAATIVSLHAEAGEFVDADMVLVRFGEAE